MSAVIQLRPTLPNYPLYPQGHKGQVQMSNEDYHAAPGISSSGLQYLDESVLHFDNKHLFQANSTAFTFGSLVHKLILEPGDFAKEFAVSPKFDLRTNAGKEGKAEFEKTNQGKTVVNDDDLATAQRMAANCMAIAGNLFRHGEAEQSYFADDNGLTLKCRPDYYIKQLGIVVDVKTTADCTEYGIKKTIANYRYTWSAVWYMKVLRMLGLPAERFMFVFIDKSAPHMVRIREIDPLSLEFAAIEVEALLEKYRQYKQTGKADFYKVITPFGGG